MFSEFAGLEARYIKGEASQLSVSKNGLWLRQGDDNQQSVIHALRVADQGEHLEDVLVFLYGANDHFIGRIDARSAQLRDQLLAAERCLGLGHQRRAPVHHASYKLPTTLTAGTDLGKLGRRPTRCPSGTCPAISAPPRPPAFPPRAISFISTRSMPCPRCSPPWCSWPPASRCGWRAKAASAKVILFSAACGFGVYFFQRH